MKGGGREGDAGDGPQSKEQTLPSSKVSINNRKQAHLVRVVLPADREKKTSKQTAETAVGPGTAAGLFRMLPFM